MLEPSYQEQIESLLKDFWPEGNFDEFCSLVKRTANWVCSQRSISGKERDDFVDGAVGLFDPEKLGRFDPNKGNLSAWLWINPS